MDVVADLRELGFRPVPKVAKVHVAADPDDEENDDDALQGADSDYDYLLSMALYSLTAERVRKLLDERDAKEAELNHLLAQSAKDLWSADLDAFLDVWSEHLEQDAINKQKSLRNAKGRGGAKGRKRAAGEDDEYSPVKKAKAKPKAKAASPKPKAVSPKAKAKPKVDLVSARRCPG